MLLLPFCINAYAQDDSIHVWNKWCAQKDSMLLFNGGNNVIQIFSHAIKPADIKIKSLDKSLRIGVPEIKGDTLNVIAMPFPGKGKNMRMAILNRKTSRVIKTIDFVSDSIPALVAKVGNIQSNEAARKNILSQTVLKVFFPKSLYSYPYSIQQYTSTVSTGKGSATIPVKGFFLTKEVLQEIKDAPEGTIVTFTGIKATCPDCAARTLADIKLKIR